MNLAEKFAAALNEKFPVINSWDSYFAVTRGRRFDRIITTRDGDAKRVYAFVERSSGKLVKAATWAAPAQNTKGELMSQYSLEEEFDIALAAADLHGGFLYAGARKTETK